MITKNWCFQKTIYGQEWVPHTPSLLLTWNASRSVPKQPFTSKTFDEELIGTAFSWWCFQESTRMNTNTRRPPSAWPIFGSHSREDGKPYFQTNHGMRTKHMVPHSPPSAANRTVWISGPMNKVISHRSPMSCKTIRSSTCLVGQTIWSKVRAWATG